MVRELRCVRRGVEPDFLAQGAAHWAARSVAGGTLEGCAAPPSLVGSGASPAIIKKYYQKQVRIPAAYFPDDDPPPEGYWVARVLDWGDGHKTVWLCVEGEEEFWRYVHELETFELHA